MKLKGELFPDWTPPVQPNWPVKKRGHAGQPGNGPEGETCKTCAHRRRVESGSGKVFQKCDLTRAKWTHGPGSDIRARDPACDFWEAA